MCIFVILCVSKDFTALQSNVCTLFTGNLLQKMPDTGYEKELDQLDTMLPLNPSTDVWREAQPVTKITDSVYPFNAKKTRPTENEVRHIDMILYIQDTQWCVVRHTGGGGAQQTSLYFTGTKKTSCHISIAQ